MTRQQLSQSGNPSIFAVTTGEEEHALDGFEELQIAFIAESHGIGVDQARELVRRIGLSHPDLELEAEKVARGKSPVCPATYPEETA